MKLISKIITVFLFATFLTSCSDSEEVVIDTNTIVDVAIDNNLTSLVAAVTRADLVGTLSSNGSFTVLAPTNAAFDAYLQANNYASINDVPVNDLRNLLLNHVITGTLRSTDLSTGYAKTNATSEASGTEMSIYINTESGVMFNGVSTVQTANVSADNGIVHVVNAVIDLPSVVTFVTADSNLSILESALTRENSFSYVSTLNTSASTSPAPFTVFAPDNDAFVDLLGELQLAALADVPTATLEGTLNSHVVAGSNVTENMLSDNMPINTLGARLTLEITSNGAVLVDPNNRTSAITDTNIQANNGVIHTISRVVLE